MSMRLPRAAATEAAKTRLVEPAAQLVDTQPIVPLVWYALLTWSKFLDEFGVNECSPGPGVRGARGWSYHPGPWTRASRW
jgi:hypothetical protein